jgi:DNA-binding response OmpR family regulator
MTQRTVLPRRILVAEDDDTMRTVLVELLLAEGFDVLEATNGRELFWSVEQVSQKHPVDLVVADVRMPVYNALDVVEAWRATKNGPNVVLITAFADDDVRTRASRLGVTVLDKPFETAELLRVIRALPPPRPARPPDG